MLVMRKFDIEKEIEKTLDSLDNHERVEASPFFYTKLQERLKKIGEEEVARFSFWNVWQPALVVVLIFVNVFTLVEFTTSNDNDNDVNAIASDYGISTFENLVQDYVK